MDTGTLDESLFVLGEVLREREIPPDLEDVLWTTTPQALLRDLHRPETAFVVGPHEFEHAPLIRTDAGATESAAFRLTCFASYRIPLDEFIYASGAAQIAMRALREVLARPWTDAPKLGASVELTEDQAKSIFGG